MAECHPKHPESHGYLELGGVEAARVGEASKAAGSTPSGAFSQWAGGCLPPHPFSLPSLPNSQPSPGEEVRGLE